MTNQRDQIRKLFEERPNQRVPLYPDIMTLFISAYNRCIKELREQGMTIENSIEEVDGKKRSYYVYIPREDLFL